MNQSEVKAKFLKQIAEGKEVRKLLDKCHGELSTIIEAAIARSKKTSSKGLEKLSEQQSGLLRQAIQDAYSDYQKHLDSEKSKGDKLKALHAACVEAKNALSPVLCHQELCSEMLLSEQAVAKYKHPYGLLMAFQDALYETESMIAPIANQKRTTSSKPTSRTLAVMHLALAWQSITGKFPGVSQAQDDTVKTGPFVRFIEAFMQYCDPNPEFSGSTIRGDLKAIKPIIDKTVQT